MEVFSMFIYVSVALVSFIFTLAGMLYVKDEGATAKDVLLIMFFGLMSVAMVCLINSL